MTAKRQASRGPRPPVRPTARGVALDALARIEEGAYANLVLPGLLGRSRLSERDRAFVTDLVYGTTRMRRALDWIIGSQLHRKAEPSVMRVLRLGAYQLRYQQTAAHAAVGETVSLAPPRARGLVNAVLRALALNEPPEWPDLATQLSYPDWVVDRLVSDLGESDGQGALRAMNESPSVTRRVDGYIQDEASQWVAAAVGAGPTESILDLCAAPGGKATAMNASLIVAADINFNRVSLIAENVRTLGRPEVIPIVADGVRPPFAPGAFDRVLVDAPCSGLGVLRRRPDARWRVTEDDVVTLAGLQRLLLDSAATLVKPGGWLIYSVCTLTRSETVDVDDWMAASHPRFVAQPVVGDQWRTCGRGARLFPQDRGTDGMYLLRLRRT